MFDKVLHIFHEILDDYHELVILGLDLALVILTLVVHDAAVERHWGRAILFAAVGLSVAFFDLKVKKIHDQRKSRVVYEKAINDLLKLAGLSMLGAARPPKDHIRVNIASPNPGNTSLGIRYAHGFGDEDRDRFIEIPIGTGAAGQAWVHQEPMVADLEQKSLPGQPPHWGIPFSEAGKVRASLKSVLCIPIKFSEKGTPLAVLTFDSDNSIEGMKFGDPIVQKLGYSYARTLGDFLGAIGIGTPHPTPIESKTKHGAGLSKQPLKKWAMTAAFVLLGLIGIGIYLWLQAHQNIKSIAVLPLAGPISDREVELISRGITERLNNNFSQLGTLRVMPSADLYRLDLRPGGGDKGKLRDIANEVGVDALLTTELLEQEGVLSLNLVLMDTSNGVQLWGDTLRIGKQETIKLMEDLPKQIAEEVYLKLTGQKKYVTTKHYTANQDAYREYLLGNHFWNKRSKESINRAIECYDKATTLDPRFALAYAGLANCYNLLTVYSAATPDDAFKKALDASKKAIELDDQLAEAHAARAFALYRYNWDFREAEKEFKQAINLKSTYATALHWYGEFLVPMGRPEEAIKQFQAALKEDPTSVIINADLAATYLWSRRVDEAINQLEHTIKMDKCFAYAHGLLAQAYEQKGMYQEAIEEYKIQGETSGDKVGTEYSLARIYALTGKSHEAKRILVNLLKGGQVNPYGIALIYTALGDKDQAFNWLEKAYSQRSDRLIWIDVDPMLASLQQDDRYKDILQRVGLVR